jgi:16S rRNA (uracil1498-N3)-methyltransferase
MSATPRLFVEADLAPQVKVSLTTQQAHYVLHVLRLGLGGKVRLFNGVHGEYDACLQSVGKTIVQLEVLEQTRAQAVGPDVWLLFAPLKKSSTDFLVEKAVEMGVAELSPILTERTGAKDVRTDRLQRIAIEAAEQTERLDVPPVRNAAKLARAFDDWDKKRLVYYADESGDEGDRPWGGKAGRAQPIVDVVRKEPEAKAAILIGPEGGFAPMERVWLRALPFVRPVSLGPRILRAETAAVAALAIYQALAGDWRT